jgi:hypothetical protein
MLVLQSKLVSRGCALCAVVTVTAGWLLSASAVFAAGDVNQATCPFETEASPGFRSYLPDCRAYEMVTPPYVAGQEALWEIYAPPPMSPDGEHVLGIDYAGFSGAENVEQSGQGEYGAIYEFSRTSSGWSTESLEPPASQYARREFQVASADLSQSLWKLVIQSKEGEEVGPGEAYTYAIREGAGGHARFVGVGPAEAPGGQHSEQGEHELQVAGASRDLSHIVLVVKSESGQLWPGDTTREGNESLYEYVGVGNQEPTLVGVSNPGPLEGGAHRNEAAKLESECGTILGSAGNASAYNAIAASGAVVYFTALHTEGCSGSQPTVNELYARISGSKTVAISEPSKADCGVCKTGSRAAAVFEGASEDGSKVFFLSEQELLPGAKGDSLYEYDFNAREGERVTLVSPEASGVARISQDGSHVYFVATAVRASTPDLSLPPGQQAPLAGEPNLYVFETTTEHTAFIATLLPADNNEENGTHGVWAQQDQRRRVETTPDGRFLLFASARQLTGSEDTSTASQLFEYDAQQEELVRVSIGQCPAPATACAPGERFNDNGNTTGSGNGAMILAPKYRNRIQPTEASSALSLSEAGAVVFRSQDALTRLAIAGHENVYEYHEGNVYLISPGDEAAPVYTPMPRLLGTDESGRDVFFFTTDSLVPQDVDTQASWYDARVGGGFPAPPSPGGCAGVCQGPLSATPSPLSAGSTGIAEGNLAPPVSKPVVKPKPLTRAQQLAKALKACRAKHNKHRRAVCESQAHKRYGPKAKKAGTSRRGKR